MLEGCGIKTIMLLIYLTLFPGPADILNKGGSHPGFLSHVTANITFFPQ